MQASTSGTCVTTEWFAISLDHINEEMMISTRLQVQSGSELHHQAQPGGSVSSFFQEHTEG